MVGVNPACVYETWRAKRCEQLDNLVKHYTSASICLKAKQQNSFSQALFVPGRFDYVQQVFCRLILLVNLFLLAQRPVLKKMIHEILFVFLSLSAGWSADRVWLLLRGVRIREDDAVFRRPPVL